MSYTKGLRYDTTPGGRSNDENTHYTREALNPAYTATLALLPTKECTKVEVALTGDQTVTAGVTKPFIGDKLLMAFTTDGTERTVTFSTGFIPAATLVIPDASQAIIEFVFVGGVEKWVEKSRQLFV